MDRQTAPRDWMTNDWAEARCEALVGAYIMEILSNQENNLLWLGGNLRGRKRGRKVHLFYVPGRDNCCSRLEDVPARASRG